MALTTANVTLAVDAAVDGTTHIQLHDGDPGAAGTNNIAAEVSGRLAFAFPGATAGETEQTGTFTITGAGGPYTHVTGWSASTSGTYQWTAALSPAETFAGAGELEVTVTVTGSST